jgi:hypothetical protein
MRKWLFSLALPAIMLAVVILGATTPSVKARAQNLLRQVGQFLLVEDKQPVNDVNVRGHQGVWIEGISMGIPSSQVWQTEIVQLNALLWEEDGFTFLVTTDVLSMDAVIDAANGLK